MIEHTYSLPGCDEVMVQFGEDRPRVPVRVYCYPDAWFLDPFQTIGMDGMGHPGLLWGQADHSQYFVARDPVAALAFLRRHGYMR